MYRYYFTFKKDDKRTRWLYNDQTDQWKKARPSTYSERSIYTFVWSFSALLFFLFMFITAIQYAPFHGPSYAFKLGDAMLIVLWLIYFVMMVLIAFFIHRSIRSFALYYIASITVLVLSDLLIRDYMTSVYLYFVFAFIISSLTLIIVNIIKILFSRTPRVPKKRQKDKDLAKI